MYANTHRDAYVRIDVFRTQSHTHMYYWLTNINCVTILTLYYNINDMTILTLYINSWR